MIYIVFYIPELVAIFIVLLFLYLLYILYFIDSPLVYGEISDKRRV